MPEIGTRLYYGGLYGPLYGAGHKKMGGIESVPVLLSDSCYSNLSSDSQFPFLFNPPSNASMSLSTSFLNRASER